MSALVIVPDETLNPLALLLKARISAIAAVLGATQLAEVCGNLGQRVVKRLLQPAPEQEILLWGRVESGGFTVAWSSLTPEDEVVQIATAAADFGMISEVFASGRATILSTPELQSDSWSNLEQRRGRALTGMAAAPVFLFSECPAVLSVATYHSNTSPAHSPRESLAALSDAAMVLSRLMEDFMIRACVGFEAS